MKVRILGCGSSGGVPRIGGNWGDCDPLNPKNRRRRCSILVSSGICRLLVDTSPDMREQLLDAGVERLDAVIYTHAHADQAHGIDDLRMLAIRERRRVPVFAAPDTLELLKRRFDYCFEQIHDYPPILDGNPIAGRLRFGDGEAAIWADSVTVRHGAIDASGFLIGTRGTEASGPMVAYIPDVSMIDDEVLARLSGIPVLIIDALRYKPHPSHAHVEQTLRWIDEINPARAILTNMHIDLDFARLTQELPPGIEPAFDGMEIEVGP